MASKLRKIISREMFIPGPLGLLVNPVYIIRKGLLRGINNNKEYFHGRLLDFGCGRKPYRDLLEVEEYIGLDTANSGHDHAKESVDVYYDGQTIPFDNDYFDSVLSSETFEHVADLAGSIQEIHRVMKTNGYLVVTMPFVWEEHEVPYDFVRYTSFGITKLLENFGFSIIKIEKSTNYIETIFQLWNIYIYENIFPKKILTKLVLNPFFIAPFTIVGLVLSRILPKSQALYHNNIIVAQKIASARKDC